MNVQLKITFQTYVSSVSAKVAADEDNASLIQSNSFVSVAASHQGAN